MRHRSRVRIGLRGINTRRLLFINGQIAKGNLKPKRRRSRTENLRRIVDQLYLAELMTAPLKREGEQS